jgi:LuxR family maltose regulon positive regulatory protein
MASSNPIEDHSAHSPLLDPELPDLPRHYIARPRLHRMVDEAVASAAIVSLVAPAAFGKSTLLLGWNASRPQPRMAYLTLDPLDNDPAWFWTRAAQAVRSLETAGEKADSVVPSSGWDQRSVLASVRDVLTEPEDAVLALDDVHAVTNPAVIEAIEDLLVNLPRPLRVILSSRTELPFRAGLLRVRAGLAEIPARDLAFDPTELTAFVRGLSEVELDPEDVTAIHERTEGWVGGVRLAAISLVGHPEPAAFVRSFEGSDRYVADLLQREVLEAQRPAVRRFLLATSVLDTLDPSLCDEVTGSRRSAAVLQELERLGLFLEPLASGSGFRYQPLFRQFLRHQLHILDPELKGAAHRAAAGWYERRDDIETAIHHLLAAGEPAAAIELVLEHGLRVAATGKLSRLRSWLGLLPDDVLTRQLDLLLAIIRLCVMTGLQEEATMWTERVRWRLAGIDEPELDAELALLSGYLRAHVGQLEGTVSDGERALMLASRIDTPEPSLLPRVRHLLAAAYAGMDDFEACRRHREAAGPGEQYELPRAAYSAWLSYREGHLEEAIGHADILLARSRTPWERLTALIARGGARRERSQLAEAEADLLAALELAERWSRPLSTAFGSIELALLRSVQGRLAEAIEQLGAARLVVEGPWLRQRIDATEASLWLRAGNVARSRSLRLRLGPGPETALLDVRLALVDGEIDEAISGLAGFDARSVQQRISASLLRAQARTTWDEPSALVQLSQAVELGRPERFVQTFLEDLPELQPLLGRLVAAADDPYLSMLHAALLDQARAVPERAVIAEELSSREQVVLSYLTTSLSNKEIASELHMSLHTVKSHLKSIYRKLGTGSRRETVATARAHHLL